MADKVESKVDHAVEMDEEEGESHRFNMVLSSSEFQEISELASQRGTTRAGLVKQSVKFQKLIQALLDEDFDGLLILETSKGRREVWIPDLIPTKRRKPIKRRKTSAPATLAHPHMAA